MFNHNGYEQSDAQGGVQTQESLNLGTASIFERAVAFSIDILGLFAVVYISAYILISKLGVFSYKTAWVLLVFFYTCFLLYCSFFTSGGRQTLGKFLVGIKVVDRKTGGDLSLKKALLRGLTYYLNMFTLFVGFGIALINKRHLALEDYIAGSEVVTVREKSPNEMIALSALGSMFIGGVIIYICYIVFLSPSYYQKELVENARKQVNRLAYLEEVHKIHFGRYTSDLNRLMLISGDPVQLQRDMQKDLRRRGFSIGTNKEGFQISAIAKDKKETVITVNNKEN